MFKEFIKKHKKAFIAFVVAVLAALSTLVTALATGCKTTGSANWDAEFQTKGLRNEN